MTENTPDPEKLQARFENAFRGHRIHALPSKGGTRVFNPPTGTGWLDSARSWMGKQSDCKFYFSPSVIAPGCTTTTKDDMQESAWLWADLDPRIGQPLDEERAAMLALLNEDITAPLPTFIVDSGRGYWGFWRLKFPHKFDGPDGDATRVFEAVLRGLGNAFGDYGDRSVFNTNRIARLPGSINPKTGEMAKVVAFNPVSYTLADFPSIVVERKQRRANGDDDAMPLVTFQKMLDATPYTGGPDGMTDRSSYDGWLQIMMAFHEAAAGDCGDYLAAVIEWCQNDPNAKESWTAEKIQAHWESFDSGAAGGVTRATWTTLLASFDGNDDIVSDATPGPDARTDFGNEPPEPAGKSTPAIDLDKVKRQIRKLLRKTTAAKCTPEEAAAAALKARELMTKYDLTDGDLKKAKKEPPPTTARLNDFLANLKDGNYIFIPTRETWPRSTIESILGPEAAAVLDRTRHVAIMAWCPGDELWIKDRLLVKGGWIKKQGSNTFNTYIAPPTMKAGDATKATPWVTHFYRLYPDDAEHIIKVLAFKVRNPGAKVNHGLTMGSDQQGIGKDTLLEPIVRIVGEWNVADVTAAQAMDPKFNPHLESLICRISEANELGDDDKYSFYNRSKTWKVSPPKTFSVADKHVKAHPVVNVTLPITSSNDKGGIYIDKLDRRDYVAWSDAKQSDFSAEFFTEMYRWYDDGGVEHVYAYLMSIDLSKFDPKAPPPKTAAWKEIVNADQSTETTQLDDLIDDFNMPMTDERPVVFTIKQLVACASDRSNRDRFSDVLDLLQDKRQAKLLSRKLSRAGYQSVQADGETAEDGRWRVAGDRVVIYGRTDLPLKDRLAAARDLVDELFVSNAAQQSKARAARKAQRTAGRRGGVEVE